MSNPTYVSGLLFTKAHKLVRGRIYELLEDYRLNPTSWSVLGSVFQSTDGIRASNIAQMLNVKPPLVTMIADDLIARDLMKRVPHHSDKRAKLLVITPKGKKLAATLEVSLDKTIRGLLTGLTTAEIASFQKTLETIINNAE